MDLFQHVLAFGEAVVCIARVVVPVAILFKRGLPSSVEALVTMVAAFLMAPVFAICWFTASFDRVYGIFVQLARLFLNDPSRVK